jgi:NADH:ubiquinone oxidoreductase subunit 4 (subunit M)
VLLIILIGVYPGPVMNIFEAASKIIPGVI